VDIIGRIKALRCFFLLLKKERIAMLEIMLSIILSPLAIFCGALSVAIIYAILDKVIRIYIDFIKTIVNRDDEKC
jgi:hypothetical protein